MFFSITGYSFCKCVYLEDIRNNKEAYLLGELILLLEYIYGYLHKHRSDKIKSDLSLNTNMQ